MAGTYYYSWDDGTDVNVLVVTKDGKTTINGVECTDISFFEEKSTGHYVLHMAYNGVKLDFECYGRQTEIAEYDEYGTCTRSTNIYNYLNKFVGSYVYSTDSSNIKLMKISLAKDFLTYNVQIDGQNLALVIDQTNTEVASATSKKWRIYIYFS